MHEINILIQTIQALDTDFKIPPIVFRRREEKLQSYPRT